jgi:hypothetical protein
MRPMEIVAPPGLFHLSTGIIRSYAEATGEVRPGSSIRPRPPIPSSSWAIEPVYIGRQLSYIGNGPGQRIRPMSYDLSGRKSPLSRPIVSARRTQISASGASHAS